MSGQGKFSVHKSNLIFRLEPNKQQPQPGSLFGTQNQAGTNAMFGNGQLLFGG